MAGVAVLVYDGDCAFCASSARRLRRWSRDDLVIVPWQQADLAALGLTAEQCAAAVQLVARGGTHAGGRAIAVALQHCRRPWGTAGMVLAWAPLQPVVEWGYRQVAANRHRLPGATDACRLDGDEGRRNAAVGHGPGSAVTPAHR